MADENFKKISFELEPDADGYPPDRRESLWASEEEIGLYRIDNIPFYAKGISSGDVVAVVATEAVAVRARRPSFREQCMGRHKTDVLSGGS